MAYSTSYASLIADIIQTTNDHSEELRVALANLIGLAEERLRRDLDLKIFREEQAVGSTVSGTRTIARPGTIISTDSLWITVSGTKYILEPRSYDFCISNNPTILTTGQPAFWAQADEATYYLTPTPDAAYVITAFGLLNPSGLSPTTTTTWISDNYGDVLLIASCWQAELHLGNLDQAAVWEKDYMHRVAGARKELGFDDIDSGPAKEPAPLTSASA